MIDALGIYDRERHILGKAIRLLIYLEEVHGLFQTLSRYHVRSILVSTVSAPRQMNDNNKWVLEYEFAKRTVGQLITLKTHNAFIFESAIESLINENRR